VTKDETIENLVSHVQVIAHREGLTAPSTATGHSSVSQNADAAKCMPKIAAIVNNAGIGYYSAMETADIQQVLCFLRFVQSTL
jgi:short-subunit dehydrogenase